jgi:hypothetical protein
MPGETLATHCRDAKPGEPARTAAEGDRIQFPDRNTAA